MTPSVSPQATPAFAPPARRMWGPLLVAFVVEGLILVAAVFWLTAHGQSLPAGPAFGPIRLDLTKLPTPEPAATAPPRSAEPAKSEKAPQTKPEPEGQTKATLDLPPEHMPAEIPSRKMVHPQAAPEAAPLPLPDLSLLPREDVASVGPHQAAPPLANGQVDRMSQFYRQLNEALRAAAHYPDSARSIKMSGRVQIAVHYRDGRAWGPQILRSSGFPVLDQAVLDGVARAKWPPPPPGLEGREIVIPIMGSFW